MSTINFERRLNAETGHGIIGKNQIPCFQFKRLSHLLRSFNPLIGDIVARCPKQPYIELSISLAVFDDKYKELFVHFVQS